MPPTNFIATHPASTLMLLGVAAVSLYGLSHPALRARLAFRPCGFWQRGEAATAITCAFVHADLGHLLFNGFTFWAFGFGLEHDIGSARFLALVVFGQLVSAAGTWLAHRREPGYGTLGASGAILAVVFASIVYRPAAQLYILPLPVPIPAPWFALAYLAYSVFASRLRSGHVNHAAHIAGALAGVAFVALSDPAALARALAFVFGR